MSSTVVGQPSATLNQWTVLTSRVDPEHHATSIHMPLSCSPSTLKVFPFIFMPSRCEVLPQYPDVSYILYSIHFFPKMSCGAYMRQSVPKQKQLISMAVECRSHGVDILAAAEGIEWQFIIGLYHDLSRYCLAWRLRVSLSDLFILYYAINHLIYIYL